MAEAIVCKSGIYAITNTVNGKSYVGSACALKSRLRTHRSNLNLSKHHSEKLQRAWFKHGDAAFVFEILEYVSNKADLIAREQFWIDHLQSVRCGYNVCPIAGSPLGFKHTDATRAKVSVALMGRVLSPEARALISAANIGKRMSIESVEKMRQSHIGKKHTDETREKMSEYHTGRKKSPETIARMSKKKSPESIAKREATKRAKRSALPNS